MEPQSNFMFLAICAEAFGLSPEATLESDFVLLASTLKERNYINLQRDKQMNGDVDNDDKENTKYKYVVDFTTGKRKKVQSVKDI